MDETGIRHEPDDHRFVAGSGGERSLLEYAVADGRMTILHTGVPPALQGQGTAGRLVQAALDYARSAGLKVVPRCSYSAAWIQRHPEYADLVAGH